MIGRTTVPLGNRDEQWLERYSAKRAFEDAATSLTDSIFALNDGRELVDNTNAESALADLLETRRTHKRQLYDHASSAGYPVDGIGTRTSETLRRAWLALKSALTNDAGILKVVIDEERDAMQRLESATGSGLPEAIDRTLESAIADIQHGITRLEDLESTLAA